MQYEARAAGSICIARLRKRTCLDEVQQANAISSAVRELALPVISDHLTAAVAFAVKVQDGDMPIRETILVLRAALRQQPTAQA